MSNVVRIYWPQSKFSTKSHHLANDDNYLLLGWSERTESKTPENGPIIWNVYVVGICPYKVATSSTILSKVTSSFRQVQLVGHLFFTKIKDSEQFSFSMSQSIFRCVLLSDITVTLALSAYSLLPYVVDVHFYGENMNKKRQKVDNGNEYEDRNSKCEISPHVSFILYQPQAVDRPRNNHPLLRVMHTSWQLERQISHSTFVSATTTVSLRRSHFRLSLDWFFAVLLWLLNARVPLLNLIGIHRRVKDVTLFGQQLAQRASVLRSRDSNEMLNVVIDILCGWSLVLFIVLLLHTKEGHSVMNGIVHSTRLSDVQQWLLYRVNLSSGLEWIMSSRPAGVKLNASLASFLGQVLLVYVQWWLDVLAGLGKHTVFVLTLLLAVAAGGMSLSFALLVDLIMLHCCHILWLYSVLARIYHLQFSLLLSLWFLFRGKKWNVLKQRIDSCDYSIDQLLLGTLLFTILFFLLPTTCAFYLYLVIAYSTVLIVHTVACIILELCNHFPLYSLLRYLIFPNAFLDEPTYTYLSSRTVGTFRMTYLRLVPQKIPFYVLLRSFRRRLLCLVQHFVRIHTVKALLIGEKLSPIRLFDT
jgi:hypothetical protein